MFTFFVLVLRCLNSRQIFPRYSGKRPTLRVLGFRYSVTVEFKPKENKKIKCLKIQNKKLEGNIFLEFYNKS